MTLDKPVTVRQIGETKRYKQLMYITKIANETETETNLRKQRNAEAMKNKRKLRQKKITL